MFQQRIDKIFKDLLNIVDIAEDILIVDYDDNGRDHEKP